MPLDPQVVALFEVMQRADAPSYEEQTPVEARGRGDAAPTPFAPAVARVEMFEAPGPNGGVPVRVYTPEGSGPFPALVLIHGGGWVVGSIWGYEATARLLANAAECVVVSVEYRLAPEHKFPAAPEDCYAAAKWTYEQAGLINVDTSRIAVAGGSAGGNLAAVVALMARDRGGPEFVFQVPIYPVIERDFTRPSYVENGQGPGLTQPAMAWFWDHYLADDADADHPYVCPLRAETLAGVAPALVITAEYDPLRDEGRVYAEALRDAGVAVTYSEYPGMAHGFFGWHTAVDKAKEAVAEVAAALRRAFGTA